MAPQITGNPTVCSTACPYFQENFKAPHRLPFMWGSHRWPVASPLQSVKWMLVLCFEQPILTLLHHWKRFWMPYVSNQLLICVNVCKVKCCSECHKKCSYEPSFRAHFPANLKRFFNQITGIRIRIKIIYQHHYTHGTHMIHVNSSEI